MRKAGRGRACSSFLKEAAKVMRVMLVLFVVILSFGSTSLFASEIKEMAKKVDHEGGQLMVRILCIDGMKVFQSVAYGIGNGSGTAVSNIQLYEEKNGKTVPIRCDSQDSAKN